MLADLLLQGFELHRGITRLSESGNSHGCMPLCADADLGWVQPLGDQGGLAAGTYLHGVFDSGPWRRRWLNRLRSLRGLPPLDEALPDHSVQREDLLDRLAAAFSAHVNLEPLLQE